MDILLLLIYCVFVWLIFFKFKWLPWNITSQVIVVTIPIIVLTIVILLLNIFAPSSSDIRAMNYVVPIVPRVTGQVTEVPIEPNRPIKKGDVLFKIDPVPFELAVKAAEEAEELNPGFYQNAALRGRALLALGRRDEAKIAFTAAIAAHPAFLAERLEFEEELRRIQSN